MSEKKEAVKEVKQFTIVNAIMHLLKLDDAGIIQKFFIKEVKRFKTSIKQLEANQAQLELVHTTDKEVLQDKIEDAVDDLENAKLAVTVEDLRSNSSIDEFRVRYWNNINVKQSILDSLKEDLEDLQTDYEDEIKAIDIDIADLNDSIKMITK